MIREGGRCESFCRKRLKINGFNGKREGVRDDDDDDESEYPRLPQSLKEIQI